MNILSHRHKPLSSFFTFEGGCDQLEQYLMQSFKQILMQTTLTDEEAMIPEVNVGNRVWVMVSAVQKSVRRGDFETAFQFAKTLEGNGFGDRLWSRMAIIGLEDICLGNPYICALILLIRGKKAYRQKLGVAKVLHIVLRIMCDSVKNRSACHLAVTQVPEHALKQYMLECDTDTLLTYAKKYTWDSVTPFLFLGGDRYDNRFPQGASKEALATLINETFGGNSILELIARRGGSAESGALAAIFQYAYYYAKDEPLDWLDNPSLREPEWIDGIPDYAYDMHTYPGKAAYKRLLAQCPELQAYAQSVQTNNAVNLTGHLVFMVEGIELNRTLNLACDEVFALTSKVAQLKWVGVKNPSYEMVYEGMDIIRRNQQLLIDCRKG